MTNPESIREANLRYLNEHGFKPAAWMPLPAKPGQSADEPGFAGGILRPQLELASRFLSHAVVFAWGAAPDEFEPAILQWIQLGDLRDDMTKDELKIVSMPKTEARNQYQSSVGWRLENMWSLAWLLGQIKPRPSATTGQISSDVSDQLMNLILPDLNTTPASLVGKDPVAIDAAIAAEDLMYLAHNAVRSAQLGNLESVPEGFDPIGDGGAIHERRHALTWALSPGVSWNDTDLST